MFRADCTIYHKSPTLSILYVRGLISPRTAFKNPLTK
jgi:hypothetical protein